MDGSGSEGGRLDRRDLLKAGAGGALAIAGAGIRPALGSAAGLPKPKRGGVAQLGVVPDINPSNIFRNDNANFAWQRLVMNTLTELDHRTGLPQPQLAQSWKFTEGGTVITLQLRKGVRYHSGRAFGPADVVATIQIAQNPPWTSQFTPIIKTITDAKVVGKNAVAIQLATPLSNLFDLFESLPIVDQQTMSGFASGSSINGTGPFMFTKWNPGSSVTMTKNPHYWKGAPYLNGVNVRIITQMQALVAALQSGQVDLIWDVNPAALAPLRGQHGFRVLRSDVRGAGLLIGSNVNIPPLDQAPVRQAIAWAIDRQRIVREVFYGVGVPNAVPWAPSNPAWTKAAANAYSYNLTKAKALMARAGVNGAHLKLAVDADNPAPTAAAQIAQFNLTQAGFTTDIVALDNAQTETLESTGKLPGLYVDTHGLGQVHPATLVNGALFFRASGNASNFVTPEYTALAHEALVAGTAAQQKSVYAALTKLILDQQFASDLVNYPRVYAQQTRLHGNYYTINDRINLEAAYLS